MKLSLFIAGCVAIASPIASAAPHPQPAVAPTPTIQERRLLKGVLGSLDGLVDGVVVNLVKGLLGQLHNAIEAGDRGSVLNIVKQLVPTSTPTTVEEAHKAIEGVAKAKHTNLLEYGSNLVANGLIAGNVLDLLEYAGDFGSEKNGHANSNPDPPTSVYPKASCDAHYSVSEEKLRAAIHIPDTFTYGNKTPVILLPGTGTTSYVSFAGNFIPLLSEADWADPVWVNVPQKLLDDVQINGEYAAYALNYIASLAGRNVSVIGWSQGNIDAQWAFKYWPSTRLVTSDHVAISADYKGTVLFDALAPTGLLNTPSTVQQASKAKLISTLRSNGGDSGYVPTTSVYSGFFDEVVQPMTGEGASAYLLDSRKVGVTNVEVQDICPGQPAGTLYTHEGVLYNPLAYALAKDAITHEGPGQVSRLNLNDVCSTFLAPGLGLNDLLVTENAILLGGLAMFLYQPKPFEEPALMSYTSGKEEACVEP